MTTTTIVERLSHLTLLRAASAIHACTLPIFLYRPTGEAGGVFDAAHTFLGEYRTRTHTPRPAGVGIFFIVADVTNERNFGWNFRFFFLFGPTIPID